MGQKVNPHGMRVGIIKDWDSKWYADKKNFADNLIEDHKIREFLKKKLYSANVSKIEIERAAEDKVRIIVFTAKPGYVIGKGGADIARREFYSEGTIPLQTLRADIDYGFAEADTTYGKLGVKVWIYKGEVLPAKKNKEGSEK